jgi:hypothetical protein
MRVKAVIEVGGEVEGKYFARREVMCTFTSGRKGCEHSLPEAKVVNIHFREKRL